MGGSGGGLGSVLHMIITLRNNRDLLRGPKRFNEKKDFFNNQKELFFHGRNTSIEIHPLSKEELKALKEKIRREKIKTKRRIVVSIMSVAFIFIAGVVIVSQSTKRLSEKDKQELKRRAEEDFKIRKANYTDYIKNGDAFLNKKYYDQAIFEYGMAVDMEINDLEAQKKLMLAYYQKCIHKQYDCDFAANKLEAVLIKYPEEKEFYEYLIACKEYQGDTTDLVKYQKKLNELNENGN